MLAIASLGSPAEPEACLLGIIEVYLVRRI